MREVQDILRDRQTSVRHGAAAGMVQTPAMIEDFLRRLQAAMNGGSHPRLQVITKTRKLCSSVVAACSFQLLLQLLYLTLELDSLEKPNLFIRTHESPCHEASSVAWVAVPRDSMVPQEVCSWML